MNFNDLLKFRPNCKTLNKGAFVAGNDAGLIYGTYPKMGDHWVPNDYLSDDLNLPRNMLENGTAVQFNHRLFAHLLVAGVTSAWFMSRKGNQKLTPTLADDLCLDHMC